MKATKRSAKKRKMLKYAEITAAVLLIIAVAATLIIFYNPNPPTVKPKLEATEYFSFSDLGAEYESVTGTNSVIRIKTLYMTLTPVKGNATNVNLFPPGYTDATSTAAFDIENGTSKSFEIPLQSAYQSIKTGTTYPVKIKISSDQAAGYVTLQIPENNTFQGL
jgi:hypothetical protein